MLHLADHAGTSFCFQKPRPIKMSHFPASFGVLHMISEKSFREIPDIDAAQGV